MFQKFINLLGFGYQQDIKGKVDYSIKKYEKTYILLEKYDQQATSNPAELARPKKLQNYLRSL